MARFYGNVGYGIPTETARGVWSDVITERAYHGEVLDVTRYNASDDKVNPNLRMTQRIRFLADAFAYENFSRIKFVVWMGNAWQVTSVAVERPRLLITLGEVYHGPRAA
jgi:hypothetical protein